jgi:hypothetical protein
MLLEGNEEKKQRIENSRNCRQHGAYNGRKEEEEERGRRRAGNICRSPGVQCLRRAWYVVERSELCTFLWGDGTTMDSE